MATKIPWNFQVPNIKPYEGKSDPEEFLTLFNSRMMLLKASKGVKCKTFPCLLEKYALSWFSNLPRGCLRSHEDLTKQIKACFATNRVVVKSTTSLVGLQQEPSESLNAFMDRFNTEIGKIKNLNSIARREPITLVELRRRVVGYINMEELDAAKIHGPTKNDIGKTPAHDPQPKREEKRARGGKVHKEDSPPYQREGENLLRSS